MVTEAQVLKLIRGRRYSPMTVEEMGEALGVEPGEMAAFRALVRELEFAGEVVEVKNKRLAEPTRVDLVVGTLLCNPRGFGFLRPAREGEGDDLYISGENMSAAMHGDLVVARVPPAARRGECWRVGESGKAAKAAKSVRLHRRRRVEGGGPEIKVVSVLRRARTDVVGTLRKEGHVHYVVPDNPRLYRDIFVAAEDLGEAKPDDKVAARITVWPSRHINPAGEVVSVFGPRGQLEAERLSVVHEFNLPMEFPPDTLHAAHAFPSDVQEEDLRGRHDLRDETILTIDPEDARDFDDAVSLKRLPDGEWELGVHIADVTRYVAADAPIDAEARRRGTSVYLPGQVIPMLPEALSNQLCSLQPNVVRLTKTVRMRINEKGEVIRADVYPSAIRSCRRFTYQEVQALLEGGSLRTGEEALEKLLREMHEVAELLRHHRREMGMIEMDIPEAHIVTDEQGNTTGVELRRADESHRLIEQFMLAANEAVANYLIRHRLPYICRSHDEPEPEAIDEFRETARILGHSFPSPCTRSQIQKFLARVKGRPEEYLVNYLFLRSLKIAVYSAQDLPHYAIAAAHYLHFTSPIRRYPDLLAHRILDEHWSGRLREQGRRDYWDQHLPPWAGHSSETERNAADAERSITNRRLLDFIGKQERSMLALVVGVEHFGLKVQLTDFLLDGVVRFSTLSDAFYRVDKERGIVTAKGRQAFKVGQRIHVRVLRYDEFKHQIEFDVVSRKG